MRKIKQPSILRINEMLKSPNKYELTYLQEVVKKSIEDIYRGNFGNLITEKQYSIDMLDFLNNYVRTKEENHEKLNHEELFILNKITFSMKDNFTYKNKNQSRSTIRKWEKNQKLWEEIFKLEGKIKSIDSEIQKKRIEIIKNSKYSILLNSNL